MKFIDVVRSANTNLLRNKGRTILTIIAIFIGAFTIVLTSGINTGVNKYIDKQMASVGGEGYLEIMPNSTVDSVMTQMGMSDSGVTEYNPRESSSSLEVIDNDDIKKIRNIYGVESADTYHQVETEYITSKKTDKKFALTVSQMPTNTFNVDMTAGKMVSTDAGQYQIALAPDYATELGFETDSEAIGEKVMIGVKNSATSKIKTVDATITGIQNKSILSMGGSWVNKSLSDKIHELQTNGLPTKYADQAYFATAQLEEGLTDSEIQKVKDNLNEIGFTAMTTEDEVGMMKNFFDAMTMVLVMFGVIALLAASIGIVNTLYMSVQDRTREIGLMKAMGLAPSTIRTIFNLEAISLGFWGSILGIIVAFAVGGVINNIAAESFLSSLPGFTLVVFEPLNLIIFTIIVMFVAFLAGSLPARRASKLDPIEALRYE